MPTHRQLELFVAVADAGSMRRAADTLGISQPSISKQIKALERSVGGEILLRTRGERAVLSPLGVELLEDARNSLTIQNRLLRRAGARGGRPLRVFVRTYLLDRIKSSLDAFAAAGMPEDLSFVVSDNPPEGLLADDDPGDVLALFTAVRVPLRPEAVSHVLFEQHCSIYAAPELASALDRGTVALGETAVLLPARSFRLTPWLLGQMQALRFEPGEQRFCSQFIDLIIERVCQGEGVGLFMESNVESLVQQGRLVKIAQCPDPLHMVLMARADVHQATFEKVRRAFQGLAGPDPAVSP